jgi:hypothetical protein
VNPAGVVIAIAGTWIICQVMAGHALERLNLLQPRTTGSGGGSILPPGVPNPGSVVPGTPKNPANWWEIPFQQLPFTTGGGNSL